MVSLCALHRDNLENPHITTCHTKKPYVRTNIAKEPITRENRTFCPEEGTESERQARVRVGDCDNVFVETTTGTDARDNSGGGEVWEADIMSTNLGPMIQCRK